MTAIQPRRPLLVSRRQAMRRLLAFSFVIGLVAAAGIVVYAAQILTRPAMHSVGPPPADLPFERVSLRSGSGHRLMGWVARNDLARGGVLLLHGIRSDRRSMPGRARFLFAAGYTVLLIDLQAHGESEGTNITYGYLEALDARAAFDLLRARLPAEPLAAIGFSLGGAACLLGPTQLPVRALVLEAVFDDIEHAIENRLRMRFGPLGGWLAPLLAMQLEPRLGITMESLRPVDRIPGVTAPVLIVAGESDRRATLAQSKRLFLAAPDPKALWVVPQAGHEDFHRRDSETYERRILAFLEEHFDRARTALDQ